MTEATALRSYAYASTPLGRVVMVTEGTELVGLSFDGQARMPSVRELAAGSGEPMRTVRNQLEEYFRRARTRFELPVRLDGTPFQLAVWSALLDIPCGRTSTYAEIAERIGRPRAARAVGAANGQNPVSIVVPCHRLLGADGGLTGYGGGLDRKRRLLEIEGTLPDRVDSAAKSLRRSGG